MALQGERAPEDKLVLQDHVGPRAQEDQAPRVEMQPLGLMDGQGLTADLDLMELRGTRVNPESATA